MVENTPPIDASAPYGSLALADQRLVAPHVAVGEARLRDVLRVVGRGRHAERPEDPVAHEVAVLLPAGGRDHPPEDPVAEVRVLERGPGRPGERRARRRGTARTRRARRPCCRSPHGSSVARPADIVSRWRIVIAGESAVGGAQPASAGTCSAHRVVEPEAALVAQQEDGRRRERLGHRRDPVDRVGVGPAVLAVADGPGPARVRRARRRAPRPRRRPGSSPRWRGARTARRRPAAGRRTRSSGVARRLRRSHAAAVWRLAGAASHRLRHAHARAQRTCRSRSRPGQVCRRPSRSTKPNTVRPLGDAIGGASRCTGGGRGPRPELGGDLGVDRGLASGGEHGAAFARIRVRGRRLGGQDEEGAAHGHPPAVTRPWAGARRAMLPGPDRRVSDLRVRAEEPASQATRTRRPPGGPRRGSRSRRTRWRRGPPCAARRARAPRPRARCRSRPPSPAG